MNGRGRFLFVAASVLAYVLCFAPIYAVVGPVAAMLTVVPAITIGGLLGVRAGLLFGVLTAPLNFLLYAGVGNANGAEPATLLMGAVGCAGTAAVVGWLKGLLDRVRQQSRALEVEAAKRQQVEERLVYIATHDALTNLPNRKLALDRLGRALELSKRRADYTFAVIYLDFDRFKLINDRLGHAAGDQLLAESARRLAACLRPVDTVARQGGRRVCDPVGGHPG